MKHQDDTLRCVKVRIQASQLRGECAYLSAILSAPVRCKITRIFHYLNQKNIFLECFCFSSCVQSDRMVRVTYLNSMQILQLSKVPHLIKHLSFWLWLDMNASASPGEIIGDMQHSSTSFRLSMNEQTVSHVKGKPSCWNQLSPALHVPLPPAHEALLDVLVCCGVSHQFFCDNIPNQMVYFWPASLS